MSFYRAARLADASAIATGSPESESSDFWPSADRLCSGCTGSQDGAAAGRPG